MRSFVHSLTKYMLSTAVWTGTELGAGDKVKAMQAQLLGAKLSFEPLARKQVSPAWSWADCLLFAIKQSVVSQALMDCF